MMSGTELGALLLPVGKDWAVGLQRSKWASLWLNWLQRPRFGRTLTGLGGWPYSAAKG